MQSIYSDSLCYGVRRCCALAASAYIVRFAHVYAAAATRDNYRPPMRFQSIVGRSEQRQKPTNMYYMHDFM